MHNSFVKVAPDVLLQMKYELKQRYKSAGNSQHLSLEELLALKLFTDMDDLQKQVWSAT